MTDVTVGLKDNTVIPFKSVAGWSLTPPERPRFLVIRESNGRREYVNVDEIADFEVDEHGPPA